MANVTEVPASLLSGFVGRKVKVLPRKGIGESRDTEAGLQPWYATLVGVSLSGNPIVQEAEISKPREMRNGPVFRIEVPVAGGEVQETLQIGSW